MVNQVEEIKKKLNIVNIISHYLPVKKRGRHHLACCPFHEEKTPSFTISEELQIFKCFGCGKSGDVFTFLQDYEHIDFREALEQLAKEAGVVLIKSDNLSKEENHRKTLIGINEQAANFYNYILTNHSLGKLALEYVLKRGITIETIKKFKIGFAPKNSQLIVNFLLKKGYKKEDLISTGTFAQNKYGNAGLYDRFQDRLIFPLADYRDRILGFSGRVLPSSANSNSAKYINSPETEIYHKSEMLFGFNLAKEAVKKNNSVIITEGEFDMISPFQKGIENIVAIKGTAFTKEQLELLKRYTDNLILALDSDFAGNTAAKKSIELAESLGFDIKVLSLGEKYKDPDEAVTSDFEFFKKQLENTLPVWDFIIRSAVKKYGTDTDKNIKNIIADVLPFLVKINNSAIKSEYFRKLAFQIGTTEESIHQESLKYLSIKNTQVVGEIKPIEQKKELDLNKFSPTDSQEEYLLVLIFGARKPILLSQKLKKHFDVFQKPVFKTIADTLLNSKKFIPQKFQEKLPAEIRSVFQTIYLKANSLEIESHTRSLEIQKTIAKIKTFLIKEKMKALSLKIAQLEDSDDSKELEKTENEYNNLLKELSFVQIKPKKA